MSLTQESANASSPAQPLREAATSAEKGAAPLPAGWGRTLAGLVGVCAVFWAEALLLQLAGGVFANEFGNHPDEPGHYVTGLMVRDYLAGPHWAHPGRFADDYYRHYPKVALGHWPPFFYVVQAAWTLQFSPSHTSLLLLMGLLTALLATLLYRAVRPEFGPVAGWVLGSVLVALPLIQEYTGLLMADTLMGLLCFGAVLCFGRFLDTGTWRSALAFGLLASLAILTKGSGLVLALAPVAAVVLSHRYRLLARPAFWSPAVLVLVLCGPWSWATRHLAHNGFAQPSPSAAFTLAAALFYSRALLAAAGAGLLVLAGVGLFVRVLRPALRGGAGGTWAAAGAFLAGLLAFQCVVPVGLEDRYLIPAVPVLLLFAAAGMAWLAERLPRPRAQSARLAVVALAVVLVFAAGTFTIPRHPWRGFGPVAWELLEASDFRDAVFLVASDANGEGDFIAEVAAGEQRPGHVVLRGNKALATMDWMGHDYVPLCRTPEELRRFLERASVGVVVVDASVPPELVKEHQKLLAETMAASPDRWRLLAAYPLVRDSVVYPEGLQVYRFVGPRPVADSHPPLFAPDSSPGPGPSAG